MPFKIDLSTARHSKQLIEDGMTLSAAAKLIPCKAETLGKAFCRHGIRIKRNLLIPKQSLLRRNTIIARYLAGESELAIATAMECNRGTIRKLLINNRIPIRSISEANAIRMGKLSFRDRQKLTSGANEAMRGSDPTRRLLLTAQTKAALSSRLQGPGELELYNALEDHHHQVVRHKAIYIYNVDLVFSTVAVEVKFGGHGRFGTNISAERFEKIIESGYKPVIVIIRNIDGLRRGLNEIIALLETVDRKPATSSKYWVIRCGLQDSTIRKQNIHKGAFVVPPPELVTSIREVDFR